MKVRSHTSEYYKSIHSRFASWSAAVHSKCSVIYKMYKFISHLCHHLDDCYIYVSSTPLSVGALPAQGGAAQHAIGLLEPGACGGVVP